MFVNILHISSIAQIQDYALIIDNKTSTWCLIQYSCQLVSINVDYWPDTNEPNKKTYPTHVHRPQSI